MLDGVGIHDRTHILDGPTYDRLKGAAFLAAIMLIGIASAAVWGAIVAAILIIA